MLDWLKETEIATRLESAIARVIAEGKVRTCGKHVRSPRRHGLAVARAARIPRST
jgi:isocitrate/isopropylmalate dehydrogenase